jgi:drug/metabolite transporter (DMT)-like permease
VLYQSQICEYIAQPKHESQSQQKLNKSGILLHVAGLWTLSTLDASAKWLVLAGMPILMVTLVRYVMHVVLMTAVVVPSQGRAIFRTRSLPRQLVRGLLMVLSTVLFFSVLKRLPLAEATSLNFMAPLFLMAMAPWLLGESHRLHRWLGVLLGFAGVLIVVRPGSQLDVIGVALGLLTAITFAFFQISTRRVAHDHPLTTNYYGGLFGSVVLLLALPWFWTMPELSAAQWLLLISTGFTGFAGHLLQIMAYSRTQATLLAPFNYLQIVAAVTLGWLAFGQLPDLTTAIGIALICLGGLAVVLWETRRVIRPMAMPE